MRRQFDFRKELARTYGNARAAHRRGVFAPDLLRLATATLRTACYRLALPRLTPEERGRMLPADIPGLQELMLALDATLGSFPELAKVLSLFDGVMAELQAKDVDLLACIECATAIVKGADHAERSAGAQLQERSALVLATATRLRDNPTDEAAATEAAALLAAVARFDTRVERTNKRRQQRLRRRIQMYTTAAQDTRAQGQLDPHQIVAARGRSLLPERDASLPGPGPGEPDDAPRAKAPDEHAFPEITGAPLEECLQTPLSNFHEATEQLGGIAAQLKDDQPAEAPKDYLYHIELGALLSAALQSAPRVQAACQVEPAQLAALCAQADDSSLLSETGQLFSTMAGDGHLFVSTFTVMLHEQATAWLRDQAATPGLPVDERQRFEVEALRLDQIHGRALDRLAARKANTKGRVDAAQAELSDAQKQANLERVRDRIRRGLPVDAASFFAAEEVQQQLHQEDLARTSEAHARTKTGAAPAPARKGRRGSR